MKRLPFILLTGAIIALSLGGCANVQSWERGTLSDYKMDRTRDPIKTAVDEHVYTSREAAAGGGQSVGGPGCGCN